MNLKEVNQKKKNYLRSYQKHSRRVKRIDEEIKEIKSMKMYPSLNNDGMPHGNNNSDLSQYAVILEKKENELYQEGVKQVQTYTDIGSRIAKVEDEDQRDVLFYRYIKGMEWWQVANTMHFSESWIHELHGRALNNLKIEE